MAIFPESAKDAVKASIEMHQLLRDINRERAKTKKPTVRVGLGLHSGSLIMGIMGDEERLDAATISDTVNTASRIEGLTKYYSVSTLISEDTKDRIDKNSDFNFRYLGKVQVKGKKVPLGIYECFDAEPPRRKKLKLKTKDAFNSAIEHYLAGAFPNAIAEFTDVIAQNPDDGAALHFRTLRSSFYGLH